MSTDSVSRRTTSQTGGVCGFAFLLVALAVGPVAARTVTVASCDRTTGETTISISAAEAGDGDKALVATWSPGDIGNVATNARETAYVGAVAAADTDIRVTAYHPGDMAPFGVSGKFYLFSNNPAGGHGVLV